MAEKDDGRSVFDEPEPYPHEVSSGPAARTFRCTEECRDEHCTTPVGCEQRGQCPPQNPILQLPALISSLSEAYQRFTGERAAVPGVVSEDMHLRSLALGHLQYNAEAARDRTTAGLITELIQAWHQELGRRSDVIDDLTRQRNVLGRKCDRLGVDEMLGTISRLKALVGSEDVGSDWDGIDRSEAIRQAEQFFAEAESLRNDRALLWELLKRAVREYHAEGVRVMTEWGQESAQNASERMDLRVQLTRLGERYDGAMAAIAVAVELGSNTDPEELIEALAGVVAEREELRGDLTVLRSRVDDMREAARALFPTLVVGSNG